MADVNKSIQINFEGKTDDLQAELKRIPVVTKQAALKMASQISSALDKAAQRAQKVSQAMSASFKSVGASASKIGIASAAAGLAAALHRGGGQHRQRARPSVDRGRAAGLRAAGLSLGAAVQVRLQGRGPARPRRAAPA